MNIEAIHDNTIVMKEVNFSPAPQGEEFLFLGPSQRVIGPLVNGMAVYGLLPKEFQVPIKGRNILHASNVTEAQKEAVRVNFLKNEDFFKNLLVSANRKSVWVHPNDAYVFFKIVSMLEKEGREVVAEKLYMPLGEYPKQKASKESLCLISSFIAKKYNFIMRHEESQLIGSIQHQIRSGYKLDLSLIVMLQKLSTDLMERFEEEKGLKLSPANVFNKWYELLELARLELLK